MDLAFINSNKINCTKTKIILYNTYKTLLTSLLYIMQHDKILAFKSQCFTQCSNVNVHELLNTKKLCKVSAINELPSVVSALFTSNAYPTLHQICYNAPLHRFHEQYIQSIEPACKSLKVRINMTGESIQLNDSVCACRKKM